MGELLAVVSSAELSLWVEWYQAHGLPVDRQTWATANAGAAVAATWGGKVKPGDLIPQFSRPQQGSGREELMRFFDKFGRDPNVKN